MLDISRPTDSTARTRFIVLTPAPEKDGCEAWPTTVEKEYKYYLERSGNRSVLTGQKREDYQRQLRNSSGKPLGETAIDRQTDQNTRTQGKYIHYSLYKIYILIYSLALSNFKLQDNQVYRESEIIKGYTFLARYAIYTQDSFEIICRIHCSL